MKGRMEFERGDIVTTYSYPHSNEVSRENCYVVVVPGKNPVVENNKGGIVTLKNRPVLIRRYQDTPEKDRLAAARTFIRLTNSTEWAFHESKKR